MKTPDKKSVKQILMFAFAVGGSLLITNTAIWIEEYLHLKNQINDAKDEIAECRMRVKNNPNLEPDMRSSIKAYRGRIETTQKEIDNICTPLGFLTTLTRNTSQK